MRGLITRVEVEAPSNGTILLRIENDQGQVEEHVSPSHCPLGDSFHLGFEHRTLTVHIGRFPVEDFLAIECVDARGSATVTGAEPGIQVSLDNQVICVPWLGLQALDFIWPDGSQVRIHGGSGC